MNSTRANDANVLMNRSTDAVRLVLADSQPIALAGLVHLFSTQRGFVIVSACKDGDQALRAVRIHIDF